MRFLDRISVEREEILMARVSYTIEDKNAEILIGVLDKYKSEFIDCTQIAYYVDGILQFKNGGEIMINRRDNYPKLQILSPDTGDYTESFQENSCVFIDLGKLDVIKIETTYTPHKIGKQIKVEVIISF